MPDSYARVESSGSPSRLTAAALLGGLFFVSYLTFQAAFATSCLLADYGCLLTWTMYSGRGNEPKIFVLWRSGGETLYDEDEGFDGIGRVLGAKVDTARFVPPYLCENLPDAQAVRLEFPWSGNQETIPCP